MSTQRERPYAALTREELDDLIDRQRRVVRGRRQNTAAIAAGNMTDSDDPLDDVTGEAVLAVLRKVEAPPTPKVDPATEAAEEAFRSQQEARYRAEYGWSEENANDEATLAQLISMELEIRKINTELRRTVLPFREKQGLWDALRQVSAAHAALQKQLGIDRTTRDERGRTDDPMTVLHQQILSGADYVRQLRSEAAEYATKATSIEELRAFYRHCGAPSYEWIDSLLLAYDRLAGRDPHPDLLRLHADDERAT